MLFDRATGMSFVVIKNAEIIITFCNRMKCRVKYMTPSRASCLFVYGIPLSTRLVYLKCSLYLSCCSIYYRSVFLWEIRRQRACWLYSGWKKDRTPVCSNKLELHSRMTSFGRPMSEGRPNEEGMHKHRLWIDPEELTEKNWNWQIRLRKEGRQMSYCKLHFGYIPRKFESICWRHL